MGEIELEEKLFKFNKDLGKAINHLEYTIAQFNGENMFLFKIRQKMRLFIGKIDDVIFILMCILRMR